MSTSILADAMPSHAPQRWARVPAELLGRQPVLAWYGLILIVLLVPAGVVLLLDGRTLDGVNVWAKPMKFLASVSLFSLTMAWFYGYLPAERRRAAIPRLIVWTLVATGTFEIAYIAWQAGHGEASHFNQSTPFHAVMYALMGAAALVLTATAPALAREIARHGDRGLDPAFRLAVVLGLVLTFVLGATEGVYMSAQPGHGVGVPAGDLGLPVVGWSTTGGDLRVAHFLGIHAQQVVPFVGALLAHLLPGRAAPAVWGFAAAYGLVTAFVFVQALAGLPLIAL